MTTTQTGKRRGPVPKPKGIATAFILSSVEVPTFTREVKGKIELLIRANQYATRDDFRKAAKKAIDKHFNEMK